MAVCPTILICRLGLALQIDFVTSANEMSVNTSTKRACPHVHLRRIDPCHNYLVCVTEWLITNEPLAWLQIAVFDSEGLRLLHEPGKENMRF
jgi:hypothetical protein